MFPYRKLYSNLRESVKDDLQDLFTFPMPYSGRAQYILLMMSNGHVSCDLNIRISMDFVLVGLFVCRLHFAVK
jgi:hypothetical protein